MRKHYKTAAGAIFLAALMTTKAFGYYGPGYSSNSMYGGPGQAGQMNPGSYNNPAYDTGWSPGYGPGSTGSNPQGDREQYEANAYAGGPNSEAAKKLLEEEEDAFYIYHTYRGGVWQQEPNGAWKLLKEDGQPVSSSWGYVDGNMYLLDMYGIMQTGWQKVNGNWYYFNSKGAMQTGWLLKEGKYYFLNTDGTMAYGWVNSQGNWYYFDIQTGVMQTNTRVPDGRYVNAEGVLVS